VISAAEILVELFLVSGNQEDICRSGKIYLMISLLLPLPPHHLFLSLLHRSLC
jgi:hypothetical protein